MEDKDKHDEESITVPSANQGQVVQLAWFMYPFLGGYIAYILI